MSTRQLLIETAEKIFTDHTDKQALDAAEAGQFPEALWRILEANGLHEMALPNSGIALADVFAVFKVAGRFAVPLPLPELILGNRWRGASDGFVSVGLFQDPDAVAVPWGRRADRVLAVSAEGLRELKADTVIAGTNIAGEPRDRVSGSELQLLNSEEDPLALLALARVLQMAGGLERTLELSLRYATEREQFGRPIAGFQAIQHNLAIMAAETAAAIRSADAAADALNNADPYRLPLEIAAAKARVGEACGVVAEVAHQVHGAMGFTYEHELHHVTRRLWAWRDEFGGESYWQQRLGSALAAAGGDALWSFIASRD
jgi:acyl-CoA dehydrogenase